MVSLPPHVAKVNDSVSSETSAIGTDGPENRSPLDIAQPVLQYEKNAEVLQHRALPRPYFIVLVQPSWPHVLMGKTYPVKQHQSPC